MSQELIYIWMGFAVFAFGVCWFAFEKNKQLSEMKRHMLVVRNTVPLYRRINFFKNFGLWTLVDAKNKGGRIQFNFTYLASADDMGAMRVLIGWHDQHSLSLQEAIDQELIDMKHVEVVFNRAIDHYLRKGVWQLSNE